MSKRLLATLPLLIAALATGASAQANPQPAGNVVRTASPAARGLTEADFPRVQRLAEGVYSYEALRSSGEERFTPVSLFVVTNQGVLVAGVCQLVQHPHARESCRRVPPVLGAFAGRSARSSILRPWQALRSAVSE